MGQGGAPKLSPFAFLKVKTHLQLMGGHTHARTWGQDDPLTKYETAGSQKFNRTKTLTQPDFNSRASLEIRA